MDNINSYLYIILALVVFFCAVILYFKFNRANFTPNIPGVNFVSNLQEPGISQEPNVYETQDTRMESPLLPPVNPIVRKRIIVDNLPANSDLYSGQSYDTPYYILDTPPVDNTNQLNENKLIKIPLQFNVPYDEQLRSQDILITPYNKVKYGTC